MSYYKKKGKKNTSKQKYANFHLCFELVTKQETIVGHSSDLFKTLWQEQELSNLKRDFKMKMF